MKNKIVTSMTLAGLIGFAALSPAVAEGTIDDIESLKLQVQRLEEQNQQLMSRVSELEKIQQQSSSSPAVTDEHIEAQVSKILRHKEKEHLGVEDFDHMINKYVYFKGLIEVEASAGEDFEGAGESNFELPTVELGFVGKMTDWTSAHLTILYEEGGDDKVLIDDAHIILGNTEKFPLYLNAGRLYIPFGNFKSNMISDPLTLEIAETQETALQVGFEASGAYGSVFAFNGDTNEGGGDSQVEQFGANLGYKFKKERFSLDVGVSYINSMGDSDGLSKILKEENMLEADYVDGFGAYSIAAIGPVSLIGEYITALDDFGDEDNNQPMAFNIEAGYTFGISGIESTIAVAYQGTDDMAGHLPESRILGSFGIGIFEGTTLSFEYAHDEDYDQAEGGTDESADAFTAQLAYEF
jgi:hypothetical protein